MRQVGGGALVDNPFNNDQIPALRIPTTLMLIRTGNLCNFSALSVATGTSCIYCLSKVVEKEMHELKLVVTTISESKTNKWI